MNTFIGCVLLMLLFSGCAPQVFSPAIIAQAGPPVSFSELRKAPDRFQGKTVIFGGVIVKTTNKPEGTLLEVYQTRLDSSYRPTDIDTSGGRFLALYKGFLDNEIYRPGRKVTIAGIVRGEKVMKLGELDYHYPYLEVTEINLFAEVLPRPGFPYPRGYYSPWYPPHPWRPWDPWDPWGPWGPWYPY